MTKQLSFLAVLALALAGCNCSDASTLGLTSCAQQGDCRGTTVCCDGFCRDSCAEDDGGATGGGSGGGATGGGGGATGGGGGAIGGGGGSVSCVPACALGQVCLNGSCECDATSCPSGCCSGAACTARSLSSCAGAGPACLTGDSAKAHSSP